MERVAWTDERMDEMSHRMDAGFERLHREIRELRTELKDEIKELRTHTSRIGGGIIVGLIVAVLTNSV